MPFKSSFPVDVAITSVLCPHIYCAVSSYSSRTDLATLIQSWWPFRALMNDNDPVVSYLLWLFYNFGFYLNQVVFTRRESQTEVFKIQIKCRVWSVNRSNDMVIW
jgi:hypothetical protein